MTKEKKEIIKGHCPKCGPNIKAETQGHHHSIYDDNDDGIWAKTDFYILQCCGCESVYFKTVSVCSENFEYIDDKGTIELDEEIEYWPSPSKRKVPDWVSDLIFTDDDLYKLLKNVYKALDNDLGVLAAIGVRTVFDRASEFLGIDPELTFDLKLKKLVDSGKIGNDEQKSLVILTDAGSAAAHRGWRPKPNELDTMMSIIESFLYRTFILEDAAKKLNTSVPARKKSTRKKGQ